MTLARIIVASNQLHRGRPFQRCCSHPPCRSHLRGLPIKHLLCRQRAAVTQNASSPSGMPWVLPPPCGGLMSEPRAVLPPAWASGRRPVQCSPSAAPRSAASQPGLPSLGSAALLPAQHVSAQLLRWRQMSRLYSGSSSSQERERRKEEGKREGGVREGRTMNMERYGIMGRNELRGTNGK